MRKAILPVLFIVGGAMAGTAIIGCDTSTPNSAAQQTAMHNEAKAALERMEAQDPGLTNSLKNAVGYAIFPEVGSAAVGVGVAAGHGYVYRGGQRVGMVKMGEGSIGLQAGGDTYAELIIFQDEKALNRLMNNSFEFGSDASAIAVKDGAAGSAQFSDGSQVYVLPKGGFKAGISVKGQKFNFTGSNQVQTTGTQQTTNTNSGTTSTETEKTTVTH